MIAKDMVLQGSRLLQEKGESYKCKMTNIRNASESASEELTNQLKGRESMEHELHLHKQVDKRALLMGYSLKKWAKLQPDHTFIIDWMDGNGERRLTWRHTVDDIYKLCQAFKDLGVKKGDVVNVVGYDHIATFEVILGNLFTGYIVAQQNPDLPDDALVTIINDRMASKVVVFDEYSREKIKKLMPGLKSVQYYICVDGPAEGEKILNYWDLISKYEPREQEIEVEPEDLWGCTMSSGTTGVPKAAMWTHEAAYWASWLIGNETHRLGPEDVNFSPLVAFFWSTTPFWLTASVVTGSMFSNPGGKLFQPGRLEHICEAVTKESNSGQRKVTAILPAFLFLEMRKWTEKKAKQYNLTSWEVVTWGINVPLSVFQENDRFGIRQTKCISACELMYSGSMSPESWRLLFEERNEAVSAMFFPQSGPMTAKIVDAEGREVNLGEIGELALKGPALAHGYWGEPERWARKVKEGWLHTGDLYRVGENGYCYLVAKSEDIGMFPKDKDGKYVVPYPIQDAVTAMDKVIEASLITVSDPEYGSKYRIVVCPKEGLQLSTEEVLEVAKKVAPEYLIKDVVFRKEPVPKTATGKILVRKLAEEYEGIIPEE